LFCLDISEDKNGYPITPILRGKLGLPGNEVNIAPIAIIALQQKLPSILD